MMADGAWVAGPWEAESTICDDLYEGERGLAIIAVEPEAARNGYATPTRGMVAWVHSGMGACDTDERAIATARLIAAAPDLLGAVDPDTLEAIANEIDCFQHSARAGSLRILAKRQRAAVLKAVGPAGVKP